jgi:hypothetical protein
MSATSETSLSMKTTNEFEYGFAYVTCSSLQLAAVATLNQVQVRSLPHYQPYKN